MVTGVRSQQNDEVYDKLLRFYGKKHPNEPSDKIRRLVEIDVSKQIENGKTRKDAGLALYGQVVKEQISNYEKRIEKVRTRWSKGEISDVDYDLTAGSTLEKIGKLREDPIFKQLETLETIPQQIENYRKAIKKLATLLANREISKETYKTSVKDLEEKISDLRQIQKAPTPEAIKHWRENSFPSNPPHVKKPSGLWYLVPFFFGIIGGLIGYVALKNEDKDMAETLLVFGIFMFLVNIVITFTFYSWIISSLGI